jgi:2-polyprenyl-3-methyl-5-hydroxy-6-metoxy-1,4-benzoquinol methylase
MDIFKGLDSFQRASAPIWTKEGRQLQVQARRDLLEGGVVTIECGSNIIHSCAGLYNDAIVDFPGLDWSSPPDTMVNVRVRFTPRLLARLADLTFSKDIVSVKSSLSQFPMAAFAQGEIPDNVFSKEYLTNIKSKIGRNHWSAEGCLIGEDGRMHVLGWAIPPAGPGGGLPQIHIDGVLAEVEPSISAWARDAYWALDGQSQLGFHAIGPYKPNGGFAKIELSFGDSDLKENIVRFPIYQLVTPLDQLKLPVPPDVNIHRVSGPGSNQYSYINGGKSDFERFKLEILKRLNRQSLIGLRVLDWGVGCGRLSRHFIEQNAFVTGADIDNDNLEWCRGNLKPASFVHVPLNPPTALIANSYDVIISSSVLSHLTEEVMSNWLAEMSRVLKPEGVALLSFNGDGTSYLYGSWFPPAITNLNTTGFFDEWRTEDLDGVIADKEYYRLTLMSSSKAREMFEKSFLLEDVVKGVTSGHQDLAVLRRR